MLASAGMSSRRPSTVPSGRSAKASSVGANTVKGPSLESVPAKSAAVTAATRVSNDPLPTATSIIVPKSHSSGAGAASGVGGMSTASITWMTPLQAGTSGMITLESLTFTPSSRLISTSAPLTVATGPLVRSPLSTLPETTWYVKILVRAGMSSRRPSTVPSGRSAKASSVGANTVKGPSPERVSTKSAAITAATKVPNDPLPMATSTIVPKSQADSDDIAMSMGGRRTESITWMIPFFAMISA